MTNTMVERVVLRRMARVGLAGALAMLAGVPMVAQAQPSDPSRCEALQLKKESAFYECLSRCTRRAARGRVDGSDCDVRCESAFDAASFRVEQSAPCQPEPTPTPEPDPSVTPGENPTPPPRPTLAPDPEQCEAQLLKVAARHMICYGRCSARALRNEDLDDDACRAHCDERAAIVTEKVLAKTICGSGRVPSGEMR